MTIETVDAELVEPMNRDDAERLTMRIKLCVGTLEDNYEKLHTLVSEATQGRAWESLGLNVSQYAADLFGQGERLPIEVRRPIVAALSEAGMSTRAIASVVGVSNVMVKKDLDSGVNPVNTSSEPIRVGDMTFRPNENGSDATIVFDGPAPAWISATEALTQTSAQESGQTDGTTELAVRETAVIDTPPAPVKTIAGLDGKTYARTQSAAPRRSPLPDSFFRATYDTGKKVEALHRLINDDRFPQNAEKVAAEHRNDLLRINDLLQQVINALPIKEEVTP